ncbi:MAG: hypothetical protein ABS35_09135 [Kaistia sp. SCN 65-12]|nr:MAG: hypothetical protein ABS35_09135 [Kaistia sp. SCN 65-12]
MPRDDSRTARASDYILGLMNDTERERAERDLEVDAAFRDTVMQMAERMRVFEQPGAADTGEEERWRKVAGRIAALPQMREAQLDAIARPETISPPVRPASMGLQALPHRRALAVALGLIVAFALGYLAGRS